MTIGIDINEANIPQRVGVNQVAFNLFQALVTELDDEDKIIAFSKENPLPDMPPSSKKLNYEIFGAKRAWVLTSLTKRLLVGKPKVDVLFSPSHYTPLISFTPSVIYLMDMSYEHFGSDFFTSYDINQLKRWTPLSAKKAKKIITISEFSKKEIIDAYKIKPEKVEVVYPSFNKNLFHAKVPSTKIVQLRKKYGLKGKYLFYWGTLQPRKNINKLIEAFAKLDRSQLKLVICGKKGWLYEQIFDLVKRLNLEDRVIFIGFAPDEDLPGLIKSCRGFVLPSLYEGFGMPVVESQAVGVPVVVSRTSSLPEIAGDSAIYIEDPNSVDSIKEALEKLLSLTPAQRDKIIKDGKENSKRFDWAASAKQLINIFKNVNS
jgi:glycosyltransferase involved in cell wall biosynthesis